MAAADEVPEAGLRQLSVRYARGVDRRDTDTLLGVFERDAVLTVHRPGPGGGTTEMRGHEQIAKVTTVIARFAKTFHFLGQSWYEADGDEATGEVHCLAHHLDREGAGATDQVMLIRYQDRYRRGTGGAWAITARQVLVDWIEVRPIDIEPAAGPSVRDAS